MVSPATLLTRITQPTSHSPPDAHPTPPHDTYSQDMDSAVLFVSDRSRRRHSDPLTSLYRFIPPPLSHLPLPSLLLRHLSFVIPRSSFLVPLFHSPLSLLKSLRRTHLRRELRARDGAGVGPAATARVSLILSGEKRKAFTPRRVLL